MSDQSIRTGIAIDLLVRQLERAGHISRADAETLLAILGGADDSEHDYRPLLAASLDGCSVTSMRGFRCRKPAGHRGGHLFSRPKKSRGAS